MESCITANLHKSAALSSTINHDENSRDVGNFQFFHRNAVAPHTHEPLLPGISERVLPVLSIKSGVAKSVKQLPRAVEIERVNHHRLQPSRLVRLAVSS